ncbi:hypothetical protein ACF0H5_009049 [Mactra antiquata]
MIFDLIVISCGLHTVLSSSIQYCWKGTEDDHTGWRNIECATGKTHIPNSMSQITYGSSSDPPDQLSRSYYCMVFTYYEEEKSNNISIETVNAIYDCDMLNSCQGKNMFQDYKYTLNGKEGFLRCCDSENNCNTHQLIHQRIVQHSCYTGELSTKKLQIETCPQQKSHCVRIKNKQVLQESSAISVVNEQFFCDVNNKVCGVDDMEEVLTQSCKEHSYVDESGVTMETETCCCKNNLCYIPTWAEEANVDNVMTKTDKQSTWQQTLLIIIGIALGILVVSAVVFFIIRTIRNKKIPEEPRTQYNTTAYRHVTSSNYEDDDVVQILPDPDA